jgi:outer membrane protein OmpA-like peptidoglycan-associated protein
MVQTHADWMLTMGAKFQFTALRALAAAAALSLTAVVHSQEPITKDVTGRDHPLLKRYEGSFIVAYSQKEYDRYKLIVGKALNPTHETSGGKRIEKEQSLEGKVTRITYYAPKGRSVLEVFRNYEGEVKSKNAETLWTGSGPEELGYDFGGVPQFTQILEGQLFPYSHTDAAYGAYKIGNSYAVVYVAAFENGVPKHTLEVGQTTVQVDIIEAKEMEQKMVTVTATEMEKQISDTGKVTLYGILFDFNKAEVKPESEPTIAEIAKLLESKPSLAIQVAGHTDNVGSIETNKTLSQKRAEAVVAAVSAKGIDAERMSPMGFSSEAPVADNATEEGRAKNRRVELVEIKSES